ncbi:hypothetical protein D3C85_902030 [compost metagenome]
MIEKAELEPQCLAWVVGFAVKAVLQVDALGRQIPAFTQHEIGSPEVHVSDVALIQGAQQDEGLLDQAFYLCRIAFKPLKAIGVAFEHMGNEEKLFNQPQARFLVAVADQWGDIRAAIIGFDRVQEFFDRPVKVTAALGLAQRHSNPGLDVIQRLRFGKHRRAGAGDRSAQPFDFRVASMID